MAGGRRGAVAGGGGGWAPGGGTGAGGARAGVIGIQLALALRCVFFGFGLFVSGNCHNKRITRIFTSARPASPPMPPHPPQNCTCAAGLPACASHRGALAPNHPQPPWSPSRHAPHPLTALRGAARPLAGGRTVASGAPLAHPLAPVPVRAHGRRAVALARPGRWALAPNHPSAGLPTRSQLTAWSRCRPAHGGRPTRSKRCTAAAPPCR